MANPSQQLRPPQGPSFSRGSSCTRLQGLLEALKHEAPFWKRAWSKGVGTWLTG